jgi:hypothetical protein
MEDQEKYLTETSMHDIVWRGIKKVSTELTSIKTLFLAFLCVAGWFDKVSDTWLIIGALATLGVKEIPSDVFGKLIDKFGGK